MASIHRVLYASDFSSASRRAFDTAVALSKTSRAVLTVLHVIEPLIPVVPEQYIPPTTWAEIDKGSRAWARRQLDALVRKAAKRGVRAKSRLADGIAAEQILRAVRAGRADFLVVGTHGRRGLSKLDSTTYP